MSINTASSLIKVNLSRFKVFTPTPLIIYVLNYINPAWFRQRHQADITIFRFEWNVALPHLKNYQNWWDEIIEELTMQQDDQIIFKHIVVPAILNLLFFINAALPITVLGCANRGLVALAIAFICIMAAFYAVIMALKNSTANKAEARWWIISTLILIIPVLGLLILA